MKRTVRVVALTAALGLTFWLGTGTPVRALSPLCSDVHGTSCVRSGVSMRRCGLNGGGVCYCNTQTGLWDCGCIVDDVGSLICPGD
jgi:hypothetical protein